MPREPYQYSPQSSKYIVSLQFLDKDPQDHKFDFEPSDEMVKAMISNQFAMSAIITKVQKSTRSVRWS